MGNKVDILGKDDKVRKLMARLTPDQLAFAKNVALTSAQNKIFTQQLGDLQSNYDELWKVLIVILHAQPDNTLRIHNSQFLRFKHEYRIDRSFDEERQEVVLRLLTVHDPMPENEKE